MIRVLYKAFLAMRRADAAFIVLQKTRNGKYIIEELGTLTIDRTLK